MFRGALLRLAAQYFVLLVLILGFFNLLVYFTVSEALNSREEQDLQHSIRLARSALTITGDTIGANSQTLADPSFADTFVRVQQINGHQLVLPASGVASVFSSPILDNPVTYAKDGQSFENQVTTDKDLFVVSTVPVKNKTGKVVGVLQVAQPISWVPAALNRLESQLILASIVALILGALASLLMALRSLRPISVSFQKQREFVADASHELRTPLTLIRTNIEAWVRRARGAPPVYAQNVLEEVDQLNRIVGDLTTLALADARQLRIDRKPMELNDVVRDLMSQTQPLADERGVHLKPELNGGVRIEGDASRVRQLLLILLDNALTHTPAGGEVSIGVLRQNGHARVTVSDTGAGIPPSDIPHIFERFYRADKARTRESGGTGLGLAIAKWIVDAHKGDINVKSSPGEGTRVAITLPAVDDPPKADPSAS
jgi:signal transduction histidine kinase